MRFRALASQRKIQVTRQYANELCWKSELLLLDMMTLNQLKTEDVKIR